MLGHSADMARRTARGDHCRIAQRGAAFQIDGDDILGLVVVQRGQNAFQQLALRREFFRRRRRLPRRLSGSGLLRWLFGGLFCGFLCRDFFCGFYGLRGFRLGGGLFGGFASQG